MLQVKMQFISFMWKSNTQYLLYIKSGKITDGNNYTVKYLIGKLSGLQYLLRNEDSSI